jgi:hypothetical protein
VIAAALALGILPARTSAQAIAASLWQRPQAVVVQTAGAYGSGTRAATFASNVKAGNWLIACASLNNAGVTISDNRGNTWTEDAHATGHYDSYCWHAERVTAGSTTVTVSGSSFTVLSIMEVSGLVSIDTADWVAAVSGPTVDVTAGHASAQNDGFAIAYASDWDNYVTWTLSGGYTAQQQTDPSGGGYISVMATKSFHGGGTQTMSIGTNFPSDYPQGILLTFKFKPSAPWLAQHASASAASATTLNVTLPHPVTAGNMLIYCAAIPDAAGVTDNRNDWNGASGQGGGSIGVITCHGLRDAAAGSTTLTFTSNSPDNLSAIVLEIGGHPSLFEQFDTSYTDATSTTATTSLPLSTPSQLVLGIAGQYYGTIKRSSFTVSPGFTIREAPDPLAGKYRMILAEKDQRSSLSGTQSFTATAPDLTEKLLVGILTVK